MLDARGMSPRDVDELALWECAVALGVLTDPTGEKAIEADRKQRSRDLIRQRMAAAEAVKRGEKPPEIEVRPVSADTLARMGDLSRGRNP